MRLRLPSQAARRGADPPGRAPGGGPGWVVAAAFLGPGTLATAGLAGARHGYALLWALALAALVALALQEMAARVALATGRPLAAVVRDALPGRGRWLAAGLVAGGIGLGNAAFQAGNLAGAALGLGLLAPGPLPLGAIAVADAAFLLLWFGRPRWVERALAAMVAVMLACFGLTLALAPVDWGRALAGLAPALPAGSAALAVGLVGTTVVPYNLFLHASLARRRGWGPGDAGPMRRDAALAIGLGGALGMAVLVASAAALQGQEPRGAGDLAAALAPLLGPLAGGAFALGLLAAGLSSAVTAPLAAAYAVTHALGWAAGEGEEERAPRFRAVWIAVLLAGLAPVLLGAQPLAVLLAAQALNGLLLPLLAVLVLHAANLPALGPLRNGRAANLAGGAAVLAAAVLGATLLARVLLGAG